MMFKKNSKKTQKNSAISAGLGYTIGNILVNGIAFISVPIFTRILSTSDFGIYSSFMAYQAILSIFIGLALHVSLKNAKYDFPDDKHGYNSAILLLMLFCMGAFLLIGIVGSKWLGFMLSLDSFLIVPLIIYGSCSALLMLYNAYLVLDYRYKEYLYVSLFYSLGSIVLAVFLILFCFPHMRYFGRILGGFFPMVLVGLFIIYSFFKEHRPVINKKYWQYGIRISIPIIPHGLSQLILTQFDRLMILRIIGSAAAGIYSFAYTLAMILQIIYTSLDSIWTTWFFEKMNRKEYGEIKQKSAWYVILVSLITVMFFLVAPEVIMVASGEAYWDAKYVVIPVGLGLYFSFLYYFPAGVEYYYKKTVFIAIGTMSAAVINIILNFIFIPKYGYVIAAYTTIFSYILYFVFHLAIAWHLEKRFVFNIKAIMVSLVATSAMAGLALVLLDKPIVRWLIFAALFLVAAIGAYKKRSVIKGFFKKESTDEV
ncbi:MAG: oligosaccharide flippase family protein [Clostridiales bacterium]